MKNGSETRFITLRWLLGLGAALSLAACTATTPAPKVDLDSAAASSVLYAWVQQGAGDDASARAIVAASNPAACPSITVDGSSYPMTQRTISPTNFTQIQVCEYALSSANPPTSLSIGTLTLPPPTQQADQILVIGDTGCREKGSTQQDCNGDPAQGAWGFPALSQQAVATQPAPNMILHVGDYLYRENGCSPGQPCGYNWPAWQADFFQAAEAGGLLRKAPWIFVRGNHEDCSRAWNGYFLFLAEGPWTASSCPETVDPYGVALDDLNVYVVDTSSEEASDAQTSFAEVKTQIGTSTTNSWLTTHVPVCVDLDCDGSMGQAFTASGLGGVSVLKWIHVGHIHLFEQIDAHGGQDPHPPQSITGGSGTELDSASHCASGGGVYCDASTYTYLTVSSQSGAWDADLYELGGSAPKQTFTIPK